jgi:hypothetical protein
MSNDQGTQANFGEPAMIRMLRLSQSLCLGGILAVAAAVGCGFLAAVGFSFYFELRRELVEVQPPGFYEQIRLLPDGTPVIDRQDWYSGARTFLDGDRSPLEAEPDERFLESARLSSRESERRQFLFDLFHIDRGRDEGVIRVGTARGRENWYFISGDAPADRGYFVGYDALSRRLVGYIGAIGFQEEPLPAADQFPIDPDGLSYGSRNVLQNDGLVYLLSGSRLMSVDLAGREVRELTAEVESMGTGWIVDAVAPETQPAAATRPFVAVRTRTHVEAWDRNGRRFGRYVIRPGFVSERHLWFYLTASGDALLSVPGEESVTREEHVERRVGFASIGPASEQATFEVILHEPIPRGPYIVSEELELNAITAGVPAPLTAATFALGINPWGRSIYTDQSFGEALSESAASTWPALVFVSLLAAGLTWLVHRRQQAHHLPTSLAWLAFVFVLGVPGWLGYRLHRRWPVSAQVPPPSRTGIEVFD